MKELDHDLMPMKAVYAYHFPEVRPKVDAVNKLPNQDRLVRTQTSVKEAQDILAPLFEVPIELPETAQGKINLDELHRPITERIVNVYSSLVHGIKEYPARYLTAGSSEGIFHVMAELKAKGKDNIYVLKGEYEGYKEIAKQLNINPIEVEANQDAIRHLAQGEFFVSNPSARDGNILDEDIVNSIVNYHHVHLDLAYVGATLPKVFEVGHPNIDTIFMSLSKPFGMFRWRIGYLLSRKPLDSMYANKWFNGTFDHLLGLKIVEEVGLTSLPIKYKGTQEAIVSEIGERFDLPLKTSDVTILSNIKASEMPKSHKNNIDIETYKRGSNYRLCLTPFFEKSEELQR